MKIEIEFTHDALEEVLLLKATRIVCPMCNGTGSHVRHDIDDSGMVDSMREDCDYDGMEEYYRGGFDVVCTTCEGQNVVEELDIASFYQDYPVEAKAVAKWEDGLREIDAEAAAERRAGA